MPSSTMQTVDGVERGTVATNGIDTYYERRGTGPPVVFVHGMFTSTTAWDVQAAALAEDHTVVTYDVRGHGRTGGSAVERYSVDLFVADLDALLAALSLEDVVLCGLSMGGAIAHAYAARHPGRLAGLVLADTFTVGEMPLAARLLFANLRVVARLDRVVRYTTLNRLQLRVGNLLSPGVAGDGVTARRLVEDGPRIPHREVAKIARAVARFPGGEVGFTAIEAPVLVLHGEHLPAAMRTLSADLVARLEAAGATVESRVVPGGGHASNVDNPAFFTAAVREFAASIGGE